MVITMKKHPIKGECGYFNYQKKQVILKTILYYITALMIFGLGYYMTGKRENLLTIVAVLDMLPASRSTVSMIMFLKTPKFENSDRLNSEISTVSKITILYELYLTSYKKNFPLDCVAVMDNHIIGLSTFSKCDINACQEHISTMVKQNRLPNVTIKIFQDERKFRERIQQLQDMKEGKNDAEIVQLLKELSL